MTARSGRELLYLSAAVLRAEGCKPCDGRPRPPPASLLPVSRLRVLHSKMAPKIQTRTEIRYKCAQWFLGPANLKKKKCGGSHRCRRAVRAHARVRPGRGGGEDRGARGRRRSRLRRDSEESDASPRVAPRNKAVGITALCVVGATTFGKLRNFDKEEKKTPPSRVPPTTDVQ